MPDAPRPLPRDPLPDATLALLREGYRYVSNRCDHLGADAFRTRLLLRETVCLRGPEAARYFYDPTLFRRAGAAPHRVRSTLFGHGGVQGLDGEAHRHRKAMFLSLVDPSALSALADRVDVAWEEAAAGWARQDRVVLLGAAHDLLCRAVTAWAGVPVSGAEAPRRTRDLVALFESAARVGPPHWRGRLARTRLEAWLGGLVEDVRSGRHAAPHGSALRVIATHADLDGERLPTRVAAVELLNLLRPTVAVARYFVFLALALHEHPAWRERLRGGHDDDLEPFVHEVRRTTPFFPVAAAVVRQAHTFQGWHVPAGARALLDLYGTNHDPRRWTEPLAFRPERFRDGPGDAWSLVPQGGGRHALHHRCPGEWLTVELMRRALVWLTRRLDHHLPAQDLTVSLTRVPARPRSGVVLAGVRLIT